MEKETPFSGQTLGWPPVCPLQRWEAAVAQQGSILGRMPVTPYVNPETAWEFLPGEQVGGEG